MNDSTSVIQTATSGLKPVMIRRKTDVFFIVLVPISFLLWLGIAIYEIPSEPLGKMFVIKRRKSRLGDPPLDLILTRSLLNITIYTIISALIMMGFLFVTTVLKARWIVFAAISLIIVAIVSYIMLMPWELAVIFFDGPESHYLLFLLVGLLVTSLHLIYQVTIFVCTKETNINLTSELISKSCPAILQSFVAVLVSLGIAFISLIVLMITINTTLGKTFDYYRWLPSSRLDLLRLSIFFIAGLHIFNFIWNFGLTVASDYFAHFYARSENDKPTTAYIFKSLTRVVRFHLGTVGFLSIPMLPSICAFIMVFKTNQQYKTKSSYLPISFFSKICLMLDISDYSLVQTSINGYKSLKSISEMVELHERSSLLFLTLNAISTKIIEICIIIATIIGMIIRLTLLPMNHDIPFTRIQPKTLTEDMMIYEVLVAAIYINYICKAVTRSAMCTYTIYQLACIQMSERMEDHIAIADQSI